MTFVVHAGLESDRPENGGCDRWSYWSTHYTEDSALTAVAEYIGMGMERVRVTGGRVATYMLGSAR